MFHYLIVGYRFFFVFLYEHLGFASAILLTSLISSFLVKPIARVIQNYVKREQAYETVLNPLITEINDSDHSGADKHFLLQDLYRRYGYSPIYATRKILPMFVQAPLLFLTYYMLEGATILDGVRFFCFPDLGSPDAILPMGINLLPFLMTGINIVAIYATVSFSRQDRIQALVVALLFLWLLYSASSSLMIYWTLNNLITCLKTLAEEKGEGARLIGRRLAFVFSPTNHHTWLRAAIHRLSPAFAIGAFVCICLSLHSKWIHTIGDTFSNRLSFATMNLFLSIAILLIAQGRKQKAVIRLIALAASCVTLFIELDAALLKFHTLLPDSARWGLPPWPRTVRLGLFAAQFFFVLILQACRFRVASLKTFWHDLPWKEISLFSCVLFSLSTHYLCMNPVMGFTLLSFFVLWFHLLCGFGGIALIGILLFVSDISARVLFRVAFLFSFSFYLMPLFAQGTGWFSPEKNIWLFWCLVLLLGSVLGILWKRAKQALGAFFVLLSLCFIVGGIHTLYTQQEPSEAPHLNSMKESFSGLDGHTVQRPIHLLILVYDGWPNAHIGDFYGIPNPFKDLEKHGFTCYPNAYMPFTGTLANMSAFFDIFQDTHLPMADILFGRAKCLRFLRSQGYQMHYVSGEYTISKTTLPLEGDSFLPSLETVKNHVRIESILWSSIQKGIVSPNAFLQFQTVRSADRAARKQDILRSVSQRPIFLYAHVGPGHTNGTKSRKNNALELEHFRARAMDSYQEMMSDIQCLPEEDSLVIVMSDHGAYLDPVRNTSQALRFMDFHANLLAIKWPRNYTPHVDVSFGPNVMLEAMICITGDSTLARFEQKGTNLLSCATQTEFSDFIETLFQSGCNELSERFNLKEQ